VPKEQIEGQILPDARIIKQAVPVPILCTGGFQTASVIRQAITNGDCDAVSMARPLVANNDLVKQFAAGRDRAEKPCTYCNRCLLQVVEHPLGCYEELRFPDRATMLREVLSVFNPPAFA
jgi:2,4-dienoyl-CoA reductase (NADPH2)